jgi:tRNA 2-selenouridine synthase
MVRELSPAQLSQFDEIIDVRSPAEFAEDHLPSAINLPVLDNDERASVGTTYVQASRFQARREGAAHVTRNISTHLQGALASKPANYRPLVYCWRGGMRSNAMATILSAVGWRVSVLEGGYKSWRRDVVEGLRENAAPLKLLLLDGQTGTAKTAILKRLETLGHQTMDLEAMANHRGSVFGAIDGRPQPSQKMFESLIWWRLLHCDPTRHILVEAESNLIGRRTLPERIAISMQAADRIEVHAPLPARATYLVEAYADIVKSLPRLSQAIDALRPYHARQTIEHWLALAHQGKLAALAAELAEQHYDPRYNKQRHRHGVSPLAVIRTERLDEAGIADSARRIADLLDGHAGAEPAMVGQAITRDASRPGDDRAHQIVD